MLFRSNANTAWINANNINVASNLQSPNLSATVGLSVGGTANIAHLVLPQITAVTVSAITYVGTTITVTTAANHGMAVTGAQFTLSGATATTNAPNGTYTVASIIDGTNFTFTAGAIPTGTIGVGSALLTIVPLLVSNGSGQFAGNVTSTNLIANGAL